MSQRLNVRFAEGSFLALMIVLCGILAVIQYRWTGELSRAEAARLRASLNERLEQLGRAFDSELRESCFQLLPSATEIEASGAEAAHAARWQQWLATDPRPLFAHIAVALPAEQGIQLLELQRPSGKLAPIAWPPHWTALRAQMESVRQGRGPIVAPLTDPGSALIEFPVFAHSPRRERGGLEREWMIFELDLPYVWKTWFPELVRTHLNSDAGPSYDLEVRLASPTNAVLYTSRQTQDFREWRPDAEASFFAVELRRGGIGRDHGRVRAAVGRWAVTARYSAGPLETVVAKTRWRNLAVAGLVISLMVAAGGMLLWQTRCSRQTAEMQMHFVATVSHELRTPLTVIRGAGHNLLKGLVRDPARITQYAQLIVQHAEQLTRMIEQVLVFSGAQKGMSTHPGDRVCLREVLCQAAETTRAELERSGCKLELLLPADLPLVEGDAGALQRAFENLLSNASKHGSAGGWIGVHAARIQGPNGKRAEISVRDRGPGIPLSEQASIFDPFYRGERARRENRRGVGLGLSLVREIVQAHGGEVTIRSEEGQGAEFCVRLPAFVTPSPQ